MAIRFTWPGECRYRRRFHALMRRALPIGKSSDGDGIVFISPRFGELIRSITQENPAITGLVAPYIEGVVLAAVADAIGSARLGRTIAVIAQSSPWPVRPRLPRVIVVIVLGHRLLVATSKEFPVGRHFAVDFQAFAAAVQAEHHSRGKPGPFVPCAN